jgi:hypothetical protein
MSKKHLLYIHHPNFSKEPKKSELVNKLLDNHYNSITGPVQPSMSFDNNVYTTPASIATVRSVKDLLNEIQQAKLELQELLEVSQDPDDHAKLQQHIQYLWNEYHKLKREEDE